MSRIQRYKTNLLVDVELSEDLGGVKKMGVVDDPSDCRLEIRGSVCGNRPPFREQSSLLDVVSEERKIENERNPVAVDEEQKGQEAMDGRFGDDVGVEAVAEIDGVDVVAIM